jgi:hypothetical protein
MEKGEVFQWPGVARPILYVNEPRKTGARCTGALRFVVCACVSADGSGGGENRAGNVNYVFVRAHTAARYESTSTTAGHLFLNRKYKADLSCSPRPYSLGGGGHDTRRRKSVKRFYTFLDLAFSGKYGNLRDQ